MTRGGFFSLWPDAVTSVARRYLDGTLVLVTTFRAFLLCTFWLAEALARAGEPARAGDMLARGCSYANDVGLLAEEVDPDSGELLGNLPQAFSHIGLINAAAAIDQAERPSGQAAEQHPHGRDEGHR